MRKLLSLMALFVVSLLVVSMVSATASTASTLGDLTEGDVTVKVNDKEVSNGQLLSVEEGETLEIEVELELKDQGEDNESDDAEGIEVIARISGHEYSDYDEIEDSTHLFDVRFGTTKYVDLELTVPNTMENGLNTLRVFVLDRNGDEIVKTFELSVESSRHRVDIEDVDFSPGTTVKAGRALLTSVMLENYGDKDEEDVKVTVEIPELGVKAVSYVEDDYSTEGDLEAGEREEVENILLMIPVNAEGDYEVEVTVSYDRYESVTKTETIHVLANEMFQKSDKLVLAVGPESQTVSAGKTATYAVALTNDGRSSKAYVLEAVTGDWATTSVSDSLVVLNKGSSQVVYIDVTTAADAAAGEYQVSLVVKSGDGETLETINLGANVVENTASSTKNVISLRNGLEIALVVLVVLLVIIGLIIGFSRLRKDDDEEEQTYY